MLVLAAETSKSSKSPLRIFQFVVIYTVKGFSIVNEAEVDGFHSYSFPARQLLESSLCPHI